jgi:hypothetical protein
MRGRFAEQWRHLGDLIQLRVNNKS